MNETTSPLGPEFIAWAKRRMQEMDREAEEVSRDLGVSSDLKYTVLHVLHGVVPGAAAPSLAGAATAPDLSRATDDELRKRIYGLTEQFLETFMKSQARTFRAIWRTVEGLPLSTLQGDLRQRGAVAPGVGFAGGPGPLLAIVSVISWAVVQSSRPEPMAPPIAQEAVVREAQVRGCSPAVSYALAEFLFPSS